MYTHIPLFYTKLLLILCSSICADESNQFVETNGKVGDQIRKEKGHENSHLNIFQKAKAVYGGADVQHRPAARSRASSILLRPSSLLSITVFGHAMAGWLVIVFLF